MSDYDDLLAEAKTKASILAKDYIPRLYELLMKEPDMTSENARARIKKDLVETWSRSTIYENLPGKPEEEKVTEESTPPVDSIVLQQTTSGNSQTTDDFGKGVVPMTTEENEIQTKNYNDLVERYNTAIGKLEGLQSHNDYQKEQIDGLNKAVKVLDDALKAKPLVETRNPNKGFWVKFSLSNVEITRPLINIINRMKGRPNQFYIEVLGDEVIEVSETRP